MLSAQHNLSNDYLRNNPERLVGALGSLQDINVAISRSKEKLIIVGSFEMMLNGLTGSYGSNSKYKQNFSQKLARLVEKSMVEWLRLRRSCIIRATIEKKTFIENEFLDGI